MNKENKKEYYLSKMQMIFNKMLANFLEMGLDKYYFKSIKNGLNSYLSIRNIYFGKYTVNYHKDNSSELIIELYRDLNKLKEEISTEGKKMVVEVDNKFVYSKFKELGWQYNVINFLQMETSKRLKNFVKTFLIHGSFATKDFLPKWSDLDTEIILNNTVFENSSNLEYVQKWMRKLSLLCDKIDPLSHHRFSFLTEFDLKYYPNFIFPKILYNYSLLLNGQSKLEIYSRDDQSERIDLIKRFIDKFENKVKNGDYGKNLNEWKNDLSCIMLWPILMLQERGIEIYKRDSFDKARKEFPETDFSVVDKATEKMKKWKRINLLKYYPNFLFTLMPFRFNQIIIHRHRKYFNKYAKDNEIENINAKALKLFKEIFNE